MAGQPFGQPLGGFLVTDLADNRSIETHDGVVFRNTQIGLRGVRHLVRQSEADQKAIQRFLAAIECFDGMTAMQLLDAKTRHEGLVSDQTPDSIISLRRRGRSRVGASTAAAKASHLSAGSWNTRRAARASSAAPGALSSTKSRSARRCACAAAAR